MPAHLRTLVAVPTLLTSREAIEEQIERLEIHYLASPEGDLHFALLSDWVDAATEHVRGRRGSARRCGGGHRRLNQRYGPAPGGDRFLLLHRRRVWNESEGRWIGWERKRGKLHELNRLLRGATDTTFVQPSGRPRHRARRCSLRRHARRRHAAAARHGAPADRQDGASAQPAALRCRRRQGRRKAMRCCSRGSRRHCRSAAKARCSSAVFSSMSGIDPYASAVSDVYQDLFGEGSYTGKGIYDVDAFEAALAGRVPDSTLLSHDLFEGIFARAGLASDVEVVEEFPARYDVAALRHHRWARGDWQLLPWIFGRGPVAERQIGRAAPFRRSAAGRCSTICGGRCRRRRQSSPCWRDGPCRFDAALVWTVFVLATIVLPTLIPVVGAILPRRAGITLRSHLRALGGDLRLALTQSALLITFLAHQAWLMGDAIVRTLVRLFVTRRHLLEWVPAAQATIGPRLDLLGFYRRMAGAVVIGAVAVAVAWLWGHGTWPLAAAVRGALDRLAGHRALGKPVAPRRRAGCRCRTPMLAPCV